MVYYNPYLTEKMCVFSPICSEAKIKKKKKHVAKIDTAPLCGVEASSRPLHLEGGSKLTVTWT